MKNYFSLVISRFRNDQPKGNLNILEEYPGDIKLVTADSKKNQTRIAGYFQGKGPSFYPMSPYKRGVIYDMVKENFSVLNKNIFPGRIKGTIPKLLINQFSWNSGHGIFSISVEYKTLFGNKIIKLWPYLQIFLFFIDD